MSHYTGRWKFCLYERVLHVQKHTPRFRARRRRLKPPGRRKSDLQKPYIYSNTRNYDVLVRHIKNFILLKIYTVRIPLTTLIYLLVLRVVLLFSVLINCRYPGNMYIHTHTYIYIVLIHICMCEYIYIYMGRVAQSVYRLTTGCTVRVWIPVGTRFSARPDRPWGPPSLL